MIMTQIPFIGYDLVTIITLEALKAEKDPVVPWVQGPIGFARKENRTQKNKDIDHCGQPL